MTFELDKSILFWHGLVFTMLIISLGFFFLLFSLLLGA